MYYLSTLKWTLLLAPGVDTCGNYCTLEWTPVVAVPRCYKRTTLVVLLLQSQVLDHNQTTIYGYTYVM